MTICQKGGGMNIPHLRICLNDPAEVGIEGVSMCEEGEVWIPCLLDPQQDLHLGPVGADESGGLY